MIEANRSSTIGYLTLTQNGKILEINPIVSQFLRMERDKLLQRDFSAFVACEDQDRWRLCANKHNEQGNLQLLLQRHDGTALQVQLQYKHQSDESGSSIIRIFLIDSMQHKQPEITLSAPNNREDYLFLFSPVIVYTCDVFSPYSAKFISTNLTKILGYTVEEFLTTPNFWADHLHPEDRDRVFANFPLLYFSGMQLHEYRFKHRDGGWKWIRDELYMIPGMNGNSIEVIGYRSDITESRGKEVALSESRNLLKTIVDTVPAGIFWKDKDLHYLCCNPKFAKDACV